MDNGKKNLCGSPSRDHFKLFHKQQLPKTFYACDADLFLIGTNPNRIVALLDYKNANNGDQITFSEIVCYEALRQVGIRVFIIESPYNGVPEFEVFSIKEFIGHQQTQYLKPWHAQFNQVMCSGTKQDFIDWQNYMRNLN
jgi:hypothetical protein